MSSEGIDLVAYDFDGVMTDNTVLVYQDGKEAVRCNRADGLGINMIRELGVSQVIISTESNPVVEMRAAKVRLPVIYNCEDKLETLRTYCHKHDHDLSKVLFVGNDINDLEVMKAVGYPICPSDAHPSILRIASLVLESRGGCGVVRELVDKFHGLSKEK